MKANILFSMKAKTHILNVFAKPKFFEVYEENKKLLKIKEDFTL